MDGTLYDALDGALDGALVSPILDGALDGTLNGALDGALDGALNGAGVLSLRLPAGALTAAHLRVILCILVNASSLLNVSHHFP